MKKDNHGISENPMYHDTWTLLKKYRDVVWSLELSVQKVRRQFQIEYGSSIEEFLESIYLAGVDFADSGIGMYHTDQYMAPSGDYSTVTAVDGTTWHPRIQQLSKVIVVDIGGFTADYLLIKNGQADLSVCDSLENGVITLYNRIKSKVNADYDMRWTNPI